MDITRRCVGLDVHREFAQVAIWQDGKVAQAGTFATTPEGVREFAAGLGPADEVALRHWLTGALATLTVKERAVIVMRYLFDLPEAAVARDLGVTVGTVKSTSSRALAKLRVRAGRDAVPQPAGPQPIGGERP